MTYTKVCMMSMLWSPLYGNYELSQYSIQSFSTFRSRLWVMASVLKLGVPFWGPQNKDHCIKLKPLCRLPYVGESNLGQAPTWGPRAYQNRGPPIHTRYSTAQNGRHPKNGTCCFTTSHMRF